MICIDCESERITTETISHRVPVRQGTIVGITIRIPVRRCIDCGNQWLDHEAEDIIEEAMSRIQ